MMRPLRLLALLLSTWITVPVTSAQEQPAAPPESDAAISLPILGTNAAVRAAWEMPRTEPAHWFRAVMSLIDLGEPELATPILQELVELQPDDAVLADLVQRFGTHRMLQLGRTRELAPTGREFAAAAMTAAAERARDPQRLAELVRQLGDPSAEIRHSAVVDLQQAGREGVIYVIGALSQQQEPSQRAGLRQALVAMRPDSVGPLLALLSSQNPQAVSDATVVLAQLGVKQAVPLLIGPAILAAAESETSRMSREAVLHLTGKGISLASAEATLIDRIQRYRAGSWPQAPDAQGFIELWDLDPATGQVFAFTLPAPAAAMVWSARLAENLSTIQPGNAAHQRLALLLGLEAASLRQGDDHALADLKLSPWLEAAVANADPHLVSEVVDEALDERYSGAARLAVELAGRSGETAILHTPDGRPAPLVRALHASHRRVRFAALAAILKLAPRTTFAGANRVADTLPYFVRDSGARGALVALPVIQRAATLAGRLDSLGFETDAANTGRQLIQLARQRSDLELILVDTRIDGPGVRETLYELRSGVNTADVPVGLVAAPGHLESARRLAEEHELVRAFSLPDNVDAVQALTQRMAEQFGENLVPASVRAEQARQALSWLAELAAGDHPYQGLQRLVADVEPSLYRAGTADLAVPVLALLGTPASQRALLNHASRMTTPWESRQQAARAFDTHVRQHGILLTRAEILAQYERYNLSAQADADSQQLLGQLLDTLEAARTN